MTSSLEVWRVYTPTNIRYASEILNAEEFDFIESQINRTKPSRLGKTWEPWISAPFEYDLPIGLNFSKRFLPTGFHKNAFYSAYQPITAVWETAHYFRIFRLAAQTKFHSPWEEKRIFSVAFDSSDAVDIRNDPANALIMTPNDHQPSQTWSRSNPNVNAVLYPSVRDPKGGLCACIYEINRLAHSAIHHEEIAYCMHDDRVVIRSNLDQLPRFLDFK